MQITDNQKAQIFELSGGNPGAIGACAQMLNEWKLIQPLVQSTLLDLLEEYGITGANIWYLFNDKCKKTTYTVALVLYAVKFGFMPEDRLLELATDSTRSVNISQSELNELTEKVEVKFKDMMGALA